MSSLDNLRKAAKRWLRALRANDGEALARTATRIRTGLPLPGLRDVQHALAREQGAESWAALKKQGDLAAAGDPLHRAAAAPPEPAMRRGSSTLLERHPGLINQRGDLAGSHRPSHRAALRRRSRGGGPRAARARRRPQHPRRGRQRHAAALRRGAAGLPGDPPADRARRRSDRRRRRPRARDDRLVVLLGLSSRPTASGRLPARARRPPSHFFGRHRWARSMAIRALVAAAPAELARRMDRTNKRRTPLHLAAVKNQPAVARRACWSSAPTPRRSTPPA